MYILFATNTVKNCLYLASKVKNEKSNTVNRCGILLSIIMSSFIPIGQEMTEPYAKSIPILEKQSQKLLAISVGSDSFSPLETKVDGNLQVRFF